MSSFFLISFSLRKEINPPLRSLPILTFRIRPKKPAFPKLSPKCQTSISRQSPLQNRPTHASSHASSSGLPTVPLAEPPDTCLLSCVKFRLADSPLGRTARHMPPLMRQVQTWRQPHLQNRSVPTKNRSSHIHQAPVLRQSPLYKRRKQAFPLSADSSAIFLG